MKITLSTFLLIILCHLTFAQTTKPFILGSIEEIQSKELSEKRILNIYFPEGYNQNDTTHYPVIYLLDGSADEDFIHIAGLVQYANFPWVNILPKSIVVGVANVDRRRDFTYPTTIQKDKKDFPTTGKSAQFISFIEKELQPFIEKKYKTSKRKMLVGQSLGGLVATEILFKKPELFSQYVIISPSLWWDKESLLRQDLSKLKNYAGQKLNIYVGVGSEGDVMINDAKNLTELLNKTNPKNLKTTFHFFEKEDHATIFHLAVYQAFEAFKEKAH